MFNIVDKGNFFLLVKHATQRGCLYAYGDFVALCVCKSLLLMASLSYFPRFEPHIHPYFKFPFLFPVFSIPLIFFACCQILFTFFFPLFFSFLFTFFSILLSSFSHKHTRTHTICTPDYPRSSEASLCRTQSHHAVLPAKPNKEEEEEEEEKQLTQKQRKKNKIGLSPLTDAAKSVNRHFHATLSPSRHAIVPDVVLFWKKQREKKIWQSKIHKSISTPIVFPRISPPTKS